MNTKNATILHSKRKIHIFYVANSPFPTITREKTVDAEKEKTTKKKINFRHQGGTNKLHSFMKTSEHVRRSRQGQMKWCWQYFMHIFIRAAKQQQQQQRQQQPHQWSESLEPLNLLWWLNAIYRIVCIATLRMALLRAPCLYMFNQNFNKSEHMAGVFICLFSAAAASLDPYRYW